MSEQSNDSTDAGTAGEDKPEARSFTQDEVNDLVGQARRDERRKANARFADYDDLKSRAEEGATAEQRIAELERQYAEAERSRLRSDIAARHGISAEDRDMFLTGADEDSLTAQAQRLAEREADRKNRGNVAPNEGGAADNTNAEGSDMRAFARSLFSSAQSDG